VQIYKKFTFVKKFYPINMSSFKTFIVFIIFIVVGFFLAPKLSVKLESNKTLPSITVRYRWSSSSPQVLEKQVTSILEGSLYTLKGISKLNSKSSSGYGYITILFDKNIDIDTKRFEVSTIIRQVYKKLPKNVSYPTVEVNSPNKKNNYFLNYRVNAPNTSIEIKDVLNKSISNSLYGINGVDQVKFHGADKLEYTISYNYKQLKKLNLTEDYISRKLKQQFHKESVGEILYKKKERNAVVTSQKEINWHIPITKLDDRLIYLNDITKIKKSIKEPTNYFRINGENAITISISAKENVNTILLAKNIENKINTLKKELPENYTLTKTYDATKYLKVELDKIYKRAIYTITILFIFIFFISRNVNYLIIVILSILANIGIAFIFYYFLNIEIQLYSLAGITISLGLIIDNTIVVVDHLKKQIKNNVLIPVLASTLTTIASLSVIYFLDDKYKINLIDFSLVIIINLGVSLAISLFLIPALIKRIPLKERKKKNYNLLVHIYKLYSIILLFLMHFRKTAIVLIILVFGIPFFMMPTKMDNDNFFEKLYNKTIGSSIYTEKIRPYIDNCLGGSFRLFNQNVFQKSTYKNKQETKLYIQATSDKGFKLEEINEVVISLENYLRQFNQIKYFISHVYQNNASTIEISFNKESSKSIFPRILKDLLIKETSEIGGFEWDIYGVGDGFSIGDSNREPVNFIVEAKGYNYADLNSWADSLSVLLKKNRRIRNITIKENSSRYSHPLYEYFLTLNKEELMLRKLNSSKIFRDLAPLAINKDIDTRVSIDGKYTSFSLKATDSKKFNLWDIMNEPIGNYNNFIKLRLIASYDKKRQDENIYKKNQEYIRFIHFQYIGLRIAGENFIKKSLSSFKEKLPLGYKFISNESQFGLSNSGTNYSLFLILIGCIIYFICAILFESIKQPFIIISLIPISFIGVFLTFYLFDFNFDQGGLASFILLSGITVNASIFILNEFNVLKKQSINKNYFDLYMISFKRKISPIILTIFSTIMGFIPFIINGEDEVFWFSLGVGTIGGLVFSLLGILFYLPLFTLKKV